MSFDAMSGMLGGGLITHMMGQLGDAGSRPFYDIYRKYYRFPFEYSQLIDMTFNKNRNRVLITSYLQKGANMTVPGNGKHYWYDQERGWVGQHYVTFHKFYDADQKDHYYVCYVGHHYVTTFGEVLKLVFKTDVNKIRVISLEKAHAPNIYPTFVDKIYKEPKPHQIDAINKILSWYDENKNNCTVMICGKRGTMKSYTAKPLKKMFEEKYENTMVRLYDDFSLTTRGFSYNSFVSQPASQYTPVIVVIDEIDRAFDYSCRDSSQEHVYVEGTCIAESKSTLNPFLDSIGEICYVINIMTTEFKPEELYDKEEWRSYIRQGRVNFFVHYYEDNGELKSEILNHDDVLKRHEKMINDKEQIFIEENVVDSKISENKTSVHSEINYVFESDSEDDEDYGEL